MKIRSFEQAKQCVDDLREFLEFADSAISGVSALKSNASSSVDIGTIRVSLGKPDPAKLKEVNGSSPGWTEGVRKILKMADKPLRPVDILERWVASGWAYPETRRTFYIGVNGGLQYLLKKQAVEKADGKYKLKQ